LAAARKAAHAISLTRGGTMVRISPWVNGAAAHNDETCTATSSQGVELYWPVCDLAAGHVRCEVAQDGARPVGEEHVEVAVDALMVDRDQYALDALGLIP